MSENQRQVMIGIALDGMLFRECADLLLEAGSKIDVVKIHDLWDREGPGVVGELKKAGAKRVLVDLKLLDIPNTVALRAAAVRDAGGDMLTVHAAGEIEMMMAALENGPETIFGITELTSLSPAQVEGRTGKSVEESVLYLANLAMLAGLHGVVSSPNEVPVLAAVPELRGMKFFTPAIRSVRGDDDQQRANTPDAAVRAGSDYLLLGREVTKADDPIAALDRVIAQRDAVLVELAAV